MVYCGFVAVEDRGTLAGEHSLLVGFGHSGIDSRNHMIDWKPIVRCRSEPNGEIRELTQWLGAEA